MVATLAPTPIEEPTSSVISEGITELDTEVGTLPKASAGDMVKKTREGTILKMRPNYQFREGNWEIGRAAERSGVEVRKFVKGDRFLAWRKATARKAKIAEKRSMGRGGKKAKGAAGGKKRK